MNEKEASKALAMIMAFFTLDPNKMKMSDQFYYLSIMMKFSEMIEPLVKEYGGSVEELQKKYESKNKEQQFKDIASAILIKAMLNNQKYSKEDDKDTEDKSDET